MASQELEKLQRKTFSIFWKSAGIYFNIVLVKNKVVRTYFSCNPDGLVYDNEYCRFYKILKCFDLYFKGKKRKIRCEYNLDASEFTKRVLKIVKRIPYGKVKYYSEIAERIGSSPRAIGQVLKRNPLPVLIPCHRVIAKNGLGGYSSGLEVKKALLKLEGII